MSELFPTVAVINLGFGNLYGLNQALERCGYHSKICTNPEDAEGAQALVLPGVGSFANGVLKLNKTGWREALENWHAAGKPILGICLGMQLFFEKSYEFGCHDGLGFFKGSVVSIKEGTKHRVPKMGWFHLQSTRSDDLSDMGLSCDERYYFVHSFGVQLQDFGTKKAGILYGEKDYAAVVREGNLWGVQFHPEKSAEAGFDFLKAFKNSL